MGHLDVAHVSYFLPDGRCLLYDVSFRIGEGEKVALLGANGAGKTTLLRLIAGDLEPSEGTIVRSGGLGVMRQFVRSVRGGTTGRALLASRAAPRVAEAARAVAEAERGLAEGDGSADAQMAY